MWFFLILVKIPNFFLNYFKKIIKFFFFYILHFFEFLEFLHFFLKKVEIIRCPDSKCKLPISEKLVSELLSRNFQEKLKKFKNRNNLMQNPNIRFCISPDCENYVLGNPNDLLLKCLCGMEFCFRCNNKWHKGKSCEEVSFLNKF